MSMTYKVYQWVRGILTFLLIIIGIVSIWFFASATQDLLANTFNKVTIIFWTVVPSAWFFFEHRIFDIEKLIKRPLINDQQNTPQVDKEMFLKSLKDSADLREQNLDCHPSRSLLTNMTSKHTSTSHAREQGAYSSRAQRR